MFSCPLLFGGDNLNKKIVLCFLLILLSVFNVKFNVCAAASTEESSTEETSESTDKYSGYNVTGYNDSVYKAYSADGKAPDDAIYSNVKDDSGHVTEGTIYYKIILPLYASVLDSAYVYTAHPKNESGLYITFDSSSTSYRNLFVLHSVGSGGFGSELYQTESYVIGQEENINKGSGMIEPNLLPNYGVGQERVSLEVFATNIPIFNVNDEEAIEKYKSSGDTSGAVNNDTYDGDKVKPKDGIEYPKNLKVDGVYSKGLAGALKGASSAYSFSADAPLKMNWNQTVDTSQYKFEVQAQCVIGQTRIPIGGSGGVAYTGKVASSDWIDFGTFAYNGSVKMSYNISNDELNDKVLESAMENFTSTYGKLKYKGYLIKQLRVRIRNHVGDKHSDWVVVTVDNDKVSSTAQLEDEDGNEVENEDYNGDDVRDDTVDTDSSVDIGGILAFIRDGFGLLGDGGVITLMSRCFVYLPASIWTMLKFLVAMMILMAVISLVKKFVF